MGRLPVVVVALVGAATLVSAASAAAPRYVLVSGACLSRPVLLGSWEENGQFYSSLVGAPRAPGGPQALRGRPRLDLAVFWTLPEPGPPTRPRDATYHDWFYLAHRGRPAVVDALVHGARVPRRAPARALAILDRNGVPTRSADCARMRPVAS